MDQGGGVARIDRKWVDKYELRAVSHVQQECAGQLDVRDDSSELSSGSLADQLSISVEGSITSDYPTATEAVFVGKVSEPRR